MFYWCLIFHNIPPQEKNISISKNWCFFFKNLTDRQGNNKIKVIYKHILLYTLLGRKSHKGNPWWVASGQYYRWTHVANLVSKTECYQVRLLIRLPKYQQIVTKENIARWWAKVPVKFWRCWPISEYRLMIWHVLWEYE